MKLGEVLTLASRSAGCSSGSGILAAYASIFVHCLLKVGPGGWRVQEALAQRLLRCSSSSSSSSSSGGSSGGRDGGRREGVAPSPLPPLSPEAASFFSPGTAPRDTLVPYNVALALKDAGELRKSALSALGEVAGGLGHSLGTHATSILTGLCGVVRMERDALKGWCSGVGGGEGEGEEGEEEKSARCVVVEAAAGVRRAAALALRLLLQDKGALGTLCGEGAMRELFHLLSSASLDDPDARVRAHAKDALAFVGDAVEERLLPCSSSSSSSGVGGRYPGVLNLGRT
jgi:hypothetical protein